MGVHVRKKELKNGRLSLYLDFYPPIKGTNGKFTRREFIDRYLFKKPSNEDEKRINKENKIFADTLRLKREKEILNEQDGIFNSSNKKKDFIEFFEKLVDKRKDDKGNYDNWLSSLNYFKAFTGGACKMGEINEDFINNFKEFLRTTKRLKTSRELKLKQNSTNSYFNKFCAAVNEAVETKLLFENPLSHIKRIPQEETLREFLTIEELQKLAKTDCLIPKLKSAALFSALTGLRWCDMKRLKWNDIQLTENDYFVHIIQKKTKDPMLHPISLKAVEVLGKRIEHNEYIFEDLVYSDGNNDILKKWILDAGITKKITLHNFRHTYATLTLNMGTDIFTVSKLMGHKHIKTTLLYSKLLTEKKVIAANLIDIEL